MVRPSPDRSDPAREDLAAAIRELRSAAKLTIDELATRSGMHGTYLSRIERGRNNPTWEKLCDLARTLGLNPSDIALAAEAHARRRRAG